MPDHTRDFSILCHLDLINNLIHFDLISQTNIHTNKTVHLFYISWYVASREVQLLSNIALHIYTAVSQTTTCSNVFVWPVLHSWCISASPGCSPAELLNLFWMETDRSVHQKNKINWTGATPTPYLAKQTSWHDHIWFVLISALEWDIGKY